MLSRVIWNFKVTLRERYVRDDKIYFCESFKLKVCQTFIDFRMKMWSFPAFVSFTDVQASMKSRRWQFDSCQRPFDDGIGGPGSQLNIAFLCFRSYDLQWSLCLAIVCKIALSTIDFVHYSRSWTVRFIALLRTWKKRCWWFFAIWKRF